MRATGIEVGRSRMSLRSCGLRVTRVRTTSEPHGHAVEVVRLRPLDLDRGELADAQRAAGGDIDGAVDLGRVALAATFRDGRADLVDQHLQAGADLALEAP